MIESYKNKFNIFFSDSLNNEQQQVVSQASGVLLVHAGAGSGKTRVITARMTHLILNDGYDPASIIAVTFTNKAAREMKERIVSFLPHGSAIPFVGTFHSYCLRLLKSYNRFLSVPDFSILDHADQEKLIKNLLTRYGVHKKLTPKNVLYAISQLKNEAVTGVVMPLFADPLMKQIFMAYEQEKAHSHCYDFDDLLVETVKLFKTHPDFKRSYQQSIKHVLIDEYQDTNQVQHALLKEIAFDHDKKFVLDSLCVVGDEDQSIYSWRGATVANIINFKHDFPQAISVAIEQNYRSVQPILDAANVVIHNNMQRKNKKLWSHKKAHDRVRVLACTSGYQEAEAAALCAKSMRAKKISLQSLAILYRSHYQSRALEEALIRNSIPYKIIGGIQFYERQEIKDLLAYMRLVVNPYDRVSLMRIINVPARGFGEKFQELLFSCWDNEPFLSFQGVIQRMIEQQLVTGARLDALKKFSEIFVGLSGADAATMVLERIINKIDYFSYLKDAHDPEDATTKTDNVKELVNAIQAMEERTPSLSLNDFLDEVALLQEHMAQEDVHEYVRLMTLHGAKGLEFNTVILAGLEEGILPSSHSLMSPEGIEEERRLLYVGITRACERLLITHARYRYTYGSMTDQRPSRFLEEVEASDCKFNEALQWGSSQISYYFDQWLAQDNNRHDVGVASVVVESKIPSSNVQHVRPAWRAAQVVNHATFGIGVIQKIEQKTEGTVFLTVKFSNGTKKLDARFVTSAGR
ncbi:MAG: UvrD-helicase domain-containing protein [Candidatus Babeliaceae bacterium]|jgi:DNA helicase-2/ATP-dependent DNA helicase PcrA